MKLEQLNARIQTNGPRRIAVAAAQDSHVLEAVSEAYKAGIAEPVLCGDIEQIDWAARQRHIDISPFELIETENSAQSVSVAVSLVKSGRADVLMKGNLGTAELMKAVLDKETGLRSGGQILSHVTLINAPHKTLYLTDCVLIMYPDLETKAKMIDNAVAVAHCMGVDTPKVAVLAAVELVNSKMPATTDAALLTVMNRRGQIKNCTVDGPLAMDLALSQEAVQIKGIRSDVAGDADVLLFHTIEAANSAMKTFTVAAGLTMGGLVVGADAPIVLTSRSDSAESKLYSIACAIHFA
ncbi:bifunctional enoyl-CoA hydratase/phosphate acetyltransferase, partial [Ruminococcaceae bacterium OttesenSCG-928-L11]|nr:bifunctional enoyl-CoA hydratase/phosphate acetyltransferase [Ruminococcaceae bacterium OttesenSCG-928-L11]